MLFLSSLTSTCTLIVISTLIQEWGYEQMQQIEAGKCY